MTPVLASIIGIVLLLAVLGFSIARPKGLPEAVAAVPAAGLALLIGLISVPDALDAMQTLGPTIGFLAVTSLMNATRMRSGSDFRKS